MKIMKGLVPALGYFLLSLLIASGLIFIIIEILPGDPAQVILGVHAREDTLAALRSELGLDQPIWWRYLAWIGQLLQGDFGTSYIYKAPVADLIMERLPVTLPLVMMAMILIFLLSYPASLLSALYHNLWPDRLVALGGQFLISIPNFWLGIAFVIIFAVWLPYFPSGGFSHWGDGFFTALSHLALPALALSLPQAALLTRVGRASLIAGWQDDYVKNLRAIGLTRTQIMTRYVTKNTMIHVVTVSGLQFSYLLAGGILIEVVFSLPGIGKLLLQAIQTRDLVMVKSICMIYVTMVIIVNLLIDSFYRLLDPRLRGSSETIDLY